MTTHWSDLSIQSDSREVSSTNCILDLRGLLSLILILGKSSVFFCLLGGSSRLEKHVSMVTTETRATSNRKSLGEGGTILSSLKPSAGPKRWRLTSVGGRHSAEDEEKLTQTWGRTQCYQCVFPVCWLLSTVNRRVNHTKYNTTENMLFKGNAKIYSLDRFKL